MPIKLWSFAARFVPGWRKQTKCPGCANQFSCGATLAGCWCSEIKLDEKTRAELSSKYSGCLCRRCLESFSETQEARGVTLRSPRNAQGVKGVQN